MNDDDDDSWSIHLRETEFSHHDPSLIRLNNGSFGACPKSVLAIQDHIRGEWLSNPDDFWYTLEDRFRLSCNAVQQLIDGGVNAHGDQSASIEGRKKDGEIVIVDSLTFGFALIAQSICSHLPSSTTSTTTSMTTTPTCQSSSNGTAIILSNYTYNAVVKAITHFASLAANPPQIFTVMIPFPLLHEETAHQEIISAYEQTLQEIQSQGKQIILGLLDHIVSLPSILMPIEELIPLFRSYNVQEILVDGAHTPGQIDLSCIPHCGADYYLANLHKWCFSPTTAAFIWINPTAPSFVSGHLHHPIVSHSYSQGLFAECAMLGTKDYSAMLAVPAGVSFLQQIGGLERVSQRNHRLCWQVMTYLSESWKTLKRRQPENLTTSMGMIGLPSLFGDTWEASDKVRIELRERYKIVIQRPFPVPGDGLYLRVSVAIYNSWREYLALEEAILEMIQEYTGVKLSTEMEK